MEKQKTENSIIENRKRKTENGKMENGKRKKQAKHMVYKNIYIIYI